LATTSRGRGIRKATPIARTVLPKVIDTYLATIFFCSPANEGFTKMNGSIAEEVACWCVIGAVEDDIIVLEEVGRI
jgi:hypothetical protein